MLATLVLWLAGLPPFAASSLSIRVDPSSPTDAIVVLTGGRLRLETGLELFATGSAKKLFISGVNEWVDRDELLRALGPAAERAACCIVLGHEADNTFGNARETANWMHEEGYKSLRLVTSWYHMRRGLLEFGRAMPQVTIVAHPVFAHHLDPERWWSWHGAPFLIIGEYDKYLAAWIRPALNAINRSTQRRRCRFRRPRALGNLCRDGRLRALAFYVAFFGVTALLGVAGLPLLLAPRGWVMRFGRFWARCVLALLKEIVGLTARSAAGALPAGPCIIAMKHQSAWDTLILPVCSTICGRDKTRAALCPLLRLYAARAGSIAIDRRGGAGALRAW